MSGSERARVLAMVVVALTTWVSAQTGERHDSYVAKAGNIFISEAEFLQRFELTPAFGKRSKSQLETEKLEVVYSLVAEKLLAQEAMARRLEKDSIVQLGVANVKKLLARDELYRQEITGAVKLPAKEIERGMSRAQRELKLEYLFFPMEDDARFLRARMRDTLDFTQLRIDSTVAHQRDTVTLVWGDADPAIEEAAYALKKGEVSPVVSAGDGFYILVVKAMTRNASYTSLQPNVLRERVAEVLRQRKEKQRLDEFVRTTLKDKIGLAKSPALRLLSKVLLRLSYDNPSDSVFVVTPAIAESIRLSCRSHLRDTVVVAGTESWSFDSVVDRLATSGFSFTVRDSIAVFAKLSTQLRIWTHQELLAQEGLARKLDQAPAVSRKATMWFQHYLAERLKEGLKDTLSLSDVEIWSYLKEEDPTIELPVVRIRELRTASLDAMTMVLDDMSKTTSFEQLVRKWSIEPKVKENGGLTDFFSILSRPPIGSIAWQMKKGDRNGPITVDGGALLFELVDKKAPRSMEDTIFNRRFRKAEAEYARLKRKGMLSVLISRLGDEMGFSIYEDRIARIKVSSLPMVTYRILGFGGRMFEVPFVDRQIDWLTIERAKTQIAQ